MLDTPYFGGSPVDTAASRFGRLTPSSRRQNTIADLRTLLENEGYLYLPGLLESERVWSARSDIIDKLAMEGAFADERGAAEGRTQPGYLSAVTRSDLADRDPRLRDLLFSGPPVKLFESLFGEQVLHFDRIWLRVKPAGPATATAPHCDVVFMGRGTENLYTMWVPLGDIPIKLGGLIVLERSHRRNDELGEYWKVDVDRYCTNTAEAPEIESGSKKWEDSKRRGKFAEDLRSVQDQLGGRWLTTEYAAGDALVFSTRLMHAALDNQTAGLRLSTDTRYQPASEPADERWVGLEYIGHGVAAKIGDIC